MKFLVVGDAMQDVYTHVNVTRLNPDDHTKPCYTVVKEDAYFPGGAGNVHSQIEALGASSGTLFGNGQIVRQRLIGPDGRTILRIDKDSPPPDPLTYTTLYWYYIRDIHLDGIFISDYLKGAITNDLIERIVTDENVTCPIFINSRRPDLLPACLDPRVAFVQMNAQEHETLKARWRDDSHLMPLVVTSHSGVKIVLGDDTINVARSFPCNPINTTGAGDTFFAVFGAALAAMVPNQNRSRVLDIVSSTEMTRAAARMAQAYAAAAVEDRYTATPTEYHAWKFIKQDEWLKEQMEKRCVLMRIAK